MENMHLDLTNNTAVFGNNKLSLQNGALNYEEAFPPLNDVSQTNVSSSSTLNKVSNNHSPKRLPPIVKPKISNVSCTLTIQASEYRYRGIQDGSSAKICNDVGKKYSVSVNLSRKNDGSITISISGNNESSMLAKSELTRLLMVQKTEIINIPKSYHGFICGKSGSRIKEIENEFFVKISMPFTSDMNDEISIVGTNASLEGAKNRLFSIYNDQSKKSHEELIIAKKYHPFICGAFNKNIENLRSQYNVKINIPPIHSESDVLVITGDREDVDKVIQNFKKIHENMERTCTSANVTVPKSQHRFVVGYRSAGLNEILEATGVSVEMPSMNGNSEMLTLTGPQDNIGAALTMTMSRANSMIQRVIECPSWLQRFLIGKNGANVSKIRGSNDKVRIDFPDNSTSTENNAVKNEPTSCGICVEGPIEQVSEVVNALEEQIKKLKLVMDFAEVPVPIEYLKHIVGKSGGNVSQIQKDFDVSIKLPAANNARKQDIVRIEGTPSGVLKAKENIEALLHKLINEKTKDLLIDQQFHKQINGNKFRISYPNIYIWFHEDCDIVQVRGSRDEVELVSAKILSIYEELANVTEISVPLSLNMQNKVFGKDLRFLINLQSEAGGAIHINLITKTNEVLIRGPKEQVLKATDLLKKLLKEIELLTCEETIKCPPSLFRTVIGKGGSNISKIRIDTMTRVVFPSLQRHLLNENIDCSDLVDEKLDDTVHLIGTKDGVDKAKKILMEKIKELQSSIEKIIHVSPKWHRHFLQKKAQALNEIIQNCGNLSISFPKMNFDSVDSDIVRIKGAPLYVDSAITQINKIVEDLEAQVIININIAKIHHRLLIGRNGDTVREFEERNNVKIKFPQTKTFDENIDETIDNNFDDLITISGLKENCEITKDEMLALIPTEEKIELDAKFHKMLIGQSGNEIKQIQKNFDIFIQLPSMNGVKSDELSDNSNESNSITVHGTVINIEKFKKKLEELVCLWNEQIDDKNARSYSDSILIPVKHHKAIIGYRGNEIKKLRDKFDVQIDMPKKTTTADVESDTDALQRVNLQGYKEKVDALKLYLIERVAYLDSLVSEELFIPHEVHSRLIGTKGSNLRKIQDEFNVYITFPNLNYQQDKSEDSTREVVIVSGLSANVDSCCDHLIDVSNDLMMEYNDKKSADDRSKSTHFYIQESSSKKKVKTKNMNGFQVHGAPWQHQSLDTDNQEEFPIIGNDNHVLDPPKVDSWNLNEK